MERAAIHGNAFPGGTYFTIVRERNAIFRRAKEGISVTYDDFGQVALLGLGQLTGIPWDV